MPAYVTPPFLSPLRPRLTGNRSCRCKAEWCIHCGLKWNTCHCDDNGPRRVRPPAPHTRPRVAEGDQINIDVAIAVAIQEEEEAVVAAIAAVEDLIRREEEDGALRMF